MDTSVEYPERQRVTVTLRVLTWARLAPLARATTCPHGRRCLSDRIRREPSGIRLDSDTRRWHWQPVDSVSSLTASQLTVVVFRDGCGWLCCTISNYLSVVKFKTNFK